MVLCAKYIVNDRGQAIIFPSEMQHSDVAKLECLGSPVSAGQVVIFPILPGSVEVQCFGESLTLHLSSRGDKDVEIISRMLVDD